MKRRQVSDRVFFQQRPQRQWRIRCVSRRHGGMMT